MPRIGLQLNRWIDRYIDDDRIMIDIALDTFIKTMGIRPEELVMSEAISKHVLTFIDRIQSGETISNEQFYKEINELAESYGCEYGLPLPVPGEMSKNYPVIAPGVPLGNIIMGNQLMIADEERHQRMEASPQEAALELINSGMIVRNSWRVLGDRTITVIQSSNGPMAFPSYRATQRVAKLLNTLGTRCESHLSGDAELRAQTSLKEKI